MRNYILIFLSFLFAQFSKAQGPGTFQPFSGFSNYQLGSVRPTSDTNIYLQANGIINEDGRIKHVYQIKGLNITPYVLNGVKFETLALFYEAEKLVRIDLIKIYVDSIVKFKDDLRDADLKNLNSYINRLSYIQGKRKIFTKNDFIFEKGYQWKNDSKVLQLKTYNLIKSPNQERMLIASIRYKYL